MIHPYKPKNRKTTTTKKKNTKQNKNRYFITTIQSIRLAFSATLLQWQPHQGASSVAIAAASANREARFNHADVRIISFLILFFRKVYSGCLRETSVPSYLFYFLCVPLFSEYSRVIELVRKKTKTIFRCAFLFSTAIPACTHTPPTSLSTNFRSCIESEQR